MAGGTFTRIGEKTRPGTYINVKNGRPPSAVSSSRGLAIIPLIGYDWGPRDEWITITSASPDAQMSKLGRSVYSTDNFMIMLQLMLIGASTVKIFIPDGGKAATGKTALESAEELTINAKYKGTLGNKIKVVSVANPVKGFDVAVFVDGAEVELFESVETVADLDGASEYVDFTGNGNLVEFAGVSLVGGTDEVVGNAGVSKFLDMSEKVRFNTMCFPTDDTSLKTACKTKIQYIRESIGWKCNAVVPEFEADYEGIITLVNSFAYAGVNLTIGQACAWLAGMTAGAAYNESLTYRKVVGAESVIGELTNEEAIAAIKKGECSFMIDTDENGNESIILEDDINTRVTKDNDTPPDIEDNRTLRVYDQFANDCLFTFKPNRFSNVDVDWKVQEGLGASMLLQYQDDKAAKNVDKDNDFKIDTEKSVGTVTVINVGIQPVTCTKKYYFTVVAR